MPQNEMDLDPVTLITVDAIGKPGERVFFLQASTLDETVSFLLEKVQLQSLVLGIDQFFKDLMEDYPKLAAASADYLAEKMHILPPVHPLFRIGELGIAYDGDHDSVCLVVKEILSGDQDPDAVQTVRCWCSRDQLKALAAWGDVVISHGRPICPQCGQPMDPEGHFCPKKNGHNHD